jgi:NAD(P)-dependent dehydrogenase (short-subunit alcohol dehydrogenase family)
MPVVLITGANRGLGLEFARQYAARGWQVLATCRHPDAAVELADLARSQRGVELAQLDVTDAGNVTDLAARLRGRAIDLLLLNSAWLGPQQGQRRPDFDVELFDRSFAANVTGPLRVALALAPQVAASQGRRIVFLGSAAGAIGLLRPPANLYAYRASKAALHLVARNLALDLAPEGIVVGLVNPGLADTRGLLALSPEDPGPSDLAPIVALVRAGVIELITAERAVAGMIAVIDRLEASTAGTFFNYDGSVLPW